MSIELKHWKHHDYLEEKAVDIERAKRVAFMFLKSLKYDKRVIYFFSDPSFKVDQRGGCLVVETNISIASEYFRDPIFSSFRIFFKKRPENVRFFHDGIKVKFSLGGQADYATVIHLIDLNIKRAIVGKRTETLFLEMFLIPFKNRFPNEIRYVHYAGTEKDLHKGKDFIVGFFCQDNVHEIGFQVKSSNRYLEKHLARYPKVSFFHFHENMLKNIHKLSCSFIEFLRRHMREEVVIWR